MEKISVLVVGAGSGRGAWAIGALAASGRFRVVALMDPSPERLALAAEEPGADGAACFTDLADALRRTSCQALAIFSPDGQHAAAVVPALAAGKYVFVEKPLEITADAVAAILEADAAVGGKTFVGHNLRYAPVYRKVREVLSQGTLGRVLTIQADEFYDGGRTYFRRWNRLQQFSGGLWITKASHDFDLLCWLAASPPTTVYASSSLDYYLPRPDAALYCRDCPLRPDCPDRYDLFMPPESRAAIYAAATEKATGRRADLCLFNSDKDTFDHGSAQITFANHIIASYTCTVVAGFTARRIRIAGTKATLDADNTQPVVTLRHRDPSRCQEIRLQDSTADAHGGADHFIFQAFADFICGDRTNAVAPAEAALAVRVGLAARQSCAEGRAVKMA